MTTLIPKYDLAVTNAINRPINEKLAESISVKDFGAVGDGTTDDTVAIQNALTYAFTNDLNLVFPTAIYKISNTLFIPQHPSLSYFGIEINGQFSTLKTSVDLPFFTSSIGFTEVTNYGTTLDTYMSQGIRLRNFNLATVSGANNSTPALKIQDWHQGCLIQNIASGYLNAMLLSNNNYYTVFDTIQSSGGNGSQVMMSFQNGINLNRVSNCVAVNPTGIGYLFNGGVTALTFSGNSIEGVAVGVKFTAAVYDVVLENNYAETFSDIVFQFTSYVESASIKNNYINFQNVGTNYLLDYVALPLNNIIIEQDNNFQGITSYAQLIKTLNNTVGYNQLTYRAKPSSSGTLLIDNTITSAGINWQEVSIQSGYKANVVNEYAVGNYSGRYTAGYQNGGAYSFTNISSGVTLALSTKITSSDTQRIYVNIKINRSGGTDYVRGEFIGTTFKDLDTSTFTPTVTVVGGYIQINGTSASAISTVFGEIRLI